MEKLLTKAKTENISVKYQFLEGLKGLSIKKKKCHIFLDETAMESTQEKKAVFAHELGHCLTDSFYALEDYENPLYEQNIRKSETQASNMAVRLTVSPDDLIHAINCSENNYQAAELLDITEQLFLSAIAYYEQANAIKRKAGKYILA